MANLADCAIAISKHDIAHNPTLKKAIRPHQKPVEGYELVEEYKTKDGSIYRLEHRLDAENKYFKDGKPTTRDEWAENMDYTSYKRIKEVVYHNGYRLDLIALHLCPYDTSVEVADFDDHLTLYFGGRWAFPTTTEDFLNELGVEWQGADAEGGMDYYNSEIGNHDFGLRWYKDKDEEGYPNWWVEDTTDLSEEELSKYEKE